MIMTEALNILWNLYDEAVKADAFESDQDKTNCQEMLTNFAPRHRDLVIEYRNDALEGADIPHASAWAVELTHVIAAMEELSFWPLPLEELTKE